MRLIGKNLILCSLLSLNSLSLNAKSVDFGLDKTTTQSLYIEENVLSKNQQFCLVKEGDLEIDHPLSDAGKNQPWTLDILAKVITQEKYPLIALYQIWQKTVTLIEEEKCSFQSNSPLDYLNFYGCCSSEQYVKQFIKLCHLLGIDTRLANIQDKIAYDFCLKNQEWAYLDILTGQFYLGWDNSTLITSENLMDDPLLILRSKTKRETSYSLKDAWQALARLKIIDSQFEESNNQSLPIEEDVKGSNLHSENNNNLKTYYTIPEHPKNENQSSTITILNETGQFNYSSPLFYLAINEACQAELMWWQISLDPEFKVIPFNLEGIEAFAPTLSLSSLDETFLNSQDTYYLRIKGSKEGKWSEWEKPFAFSVKKPQTVSLIEFDKIDTGSYKLDWTREAEAKDDSIEYLIFGSNAFDFIPSIYSSIQINGIKEDNAVIEERNDNLIAVTTDTKFVVDGHLAYYRIIARKEGQLSVPSPIIHIYDTDLIQPRTVLQMVENSKGFEAKRIAFPSFYPWTETSFPLLGRQNRLTSNSLIELHTYIASLADQVEAKIQISEDYTRPSHVSKDLWNKMKPYFLPENHPWKSKIDRIFSKTRASKNYETLRQAGFKGRITHVRKIFAGVHPECVECFFKIYCDSEVNMRYTEWQKWLDRIRGRNNVKEVIKRRGFEHLFSVPEKWCYPLPEKPAAPARSTRYLPKDFILVCSNQRPYDHMDNEKMWKTKITPQVLDALYIVLDEAGMWDSMFIFNIPFCKVDGKICFVDTEYSHKWPIRYEKLSRYLSSSNRKYWEHLIRHRGPKGYKRQATSL